ncbi:MAG: UDP-N-acetylmuramate:L-alanyl-gamma-D-glutamyl-meso-diaminopimelate ligase [Steroidobacteraceae bacterium]|jgi:UDP-N-acetylmuramate: L-alanyl-gamma-D-glutamyl-meso-diaminopimelate ligase|nr:UDP-N-acetylmuramate:L-alanyl-gamma-D-glutamyl-meso-diaminopimelate ligase [Steroidobacteraceae bacterium]
MHVHILGICGTFMGGIAALAQAAGHRVTGSDKGVYPPMSTQLEALGIGLIEGYDPSQLDPAPDVVLVGNVLSRGNPVVERLLDSGIPYTSGPQWLAEHVLRGRHVVAVAGTHGKTTTTCMVAWILEQAGLSPGFLVGGVPADFDRSARLGAGAPFVVEADEYDTAFFDKRAKFVHYRPRTLVLNNLEFDHADIYPDLASIQRQVHHLVRTVPGAGRIVFNAGDPALEATLALGCWTPREGFSHCVAAEWQARLATADGSRFEVLRGGRVLGTVAWPLMGLHNVDNALAAIAAACHAGAAPEAAVDALCRFHGVRRRMELRGVAGGVAVYDDFAHHPTAIATTLAGLRGRVGGARIVAVLEPRSNTMKLGVHREELAGALAGADRVWLYRPRDLGWDLGAVAGAIGPSAAVADDVGALVEALAAELAPGDQVLVMSNGSFEGLHGRLVEALRAKEGA